MVPLRRSSSIAAAWSAALNTLLPATITFAPAATTSPTLSAPMPPSTSTSGLTPCSAHILRRALSFLIEPGMKLCPPKPGFTVITSTMSSSSRIASSAATGVPGFSATHAFAPASWMSPTSLSACVWAS